MQPQSSLELAPASLALEGCRPEPLISYLTALGLMRIISQQKDAKARFWWAEDRFQISSALLFDATSSLGQHQDVITDFFLHEYRPTPIIVPWSGKAFLPAAAKSEIEEHDPKKDHPAGRRAQTLIQSFRDGTEPRLAPYRGALNACNEAFHQLGINHERDLKSKKWDMIRFLRAAGAEPGLLEWLDAAALAGPERFAPLLGSGGGSDGHTNFSDNFMENLRDALPQLWPRSKNKRKTAAALASDWLRGAIFGSPAQLVHDRTSALFDSGAVGGPNATQGFERKPLSNPWTVILALEGTLAFAGSVTKRLAAHAAFPFQFSLAVTASDGLTASDRAGKKRQGSEIWLPLWTSPARSSEVLTLLHEGRADVGPRRATTGVDMARSIAALGTDRGITAFQRFALVPGRVGGANYSTAASLGRFQVCPRPESVLPDPVDRWLSRFRERGEDKDAPPRIARAQRRLDQAVFDLCRGGGPAHKLALLVAIGNAEREAALNRGLLIRGKPPIDPVPTLPAAWLDQCDDASPEFTIARALAGINDPENKVGPFRANLEAIIVQGASPRWGETPRGSTVWSKAPLATNLAQILARRLLDGQLNGCAQLPLASPATASLSTIAGFLNGDCDDDRIISLLWAFGLAKPSKPKPRAPVPAAPFLLHPAYALLKLLFLPEPLRLPRFSLNISIRPEVAILSLLHADRTGEACRVAMRRLRASGLNPRPVPIRGRRVRDQDWLELSAAAGRLDPQRVAAALLIPVRRSSIRRLAKTVLCLSPEIDPQERPAYD